MAVDPELAGRGFPPTPAYAVSREKIAEFTSALGGSPASTGVDVAPPTFPIVVAFRAMNAFLDDPSVGVSLQNIVHGDQRFGYTRQVRAGDELVATLTVTNVRQAAGMDMISTSTDISTTAGEPVCVATATLVHREPTEEGAPS